MKYGPAKTSTDVNIYTPTWRNPYGEEHRLKPLPPPTRAQRLATVMRVLGKPLSIMKDWPELGPSSESTTVVGKTISMAEQKAIAAHRAALEKSIERLASQRDPLKAKLEGIETELKTLLAMLKAAGPAEGEEEEDEAPAKGKKGRKTKLHPNAVAAIRLTVKHDAVTPAMLAEETGQTGAAASQTLAVLAKAGQIRKIKRGTFAAVAP